MKKNYFFLHHAETPCFRGRNALRPSPGATDGGMIYLRNTISYGILTAVKGKTKGRQMNIATGIGLTISLVLAIAIIASAHYLQQIRDILRDIHETQKKFASRLGVPTRN